MTMIDNKKNETIKALESLAEEIKKLKDTHRQKHPIVIEFSGSPKSGKTSCINSLQLFLKRNGFSVHVVQERAGVCPVSDKLSPMFNIWTSCMSLANMIGILEGEKNTVDVLILDRGIFDALCWFQWLSDTNRMVNKLKKSAESFLLQKTFVQYINIVFAFEATPEISIEREFANLLTSKTGTIMNKKVLKEYREAIKNTKINHGGEFHKVHEIDTSSSDQDEVGRMVTEMTLNTLREQLMEKIGYFDKTAELKSFLHEKKLFEYSELEPLFQSNKVNFGLRNDVEKDDDCLQIIPIAVVTNESNEVLVAKKKNIARSVDSPEKDRTLLYFGGHTRASDRIREEESFLEVCKTTLQRELGDFHLHHQQFQVSYAARN